MSGLPTPLYDDGRVTLYCGDAADLLRRLPDASVDVVLTDPQYNAGLDYGPLVDDRLPWPAYTAWLDGQVAEMERVSRGLVLVFTSVTGMLHLAARRPPRWVAAWVKPLSLSHRVGGSPFLPHWEPCLVYGRPWGDGGRVPAYSLPDVWSSNPARRNGHPCPKPIALIRFVLARLPAAPGGPWVVLDPFAGSGTTLRAAKDLGRRAIGFEVNPAYCALAIERLRQQPLPMEVPV